MKSLSKTLNKCNILIYWGDLSLALNEQVGIYPHEMLGMIHIEKIGVVNTSLIPYEDDDFNLVEYEITITTPKHKKYTIMLMPDVARDSDIIILNNTNIKNERKNT
tara:strand:- start:2847 stop:3164 length:318 start_codon:yes stop_codon:yes gene_type:complete